MFHQKWRIRLLSFHSHLRGFSSQIPVFLSGYYCILVKITKQLLSLKFPSRKNHVCLLFFFLQKFIANPHSLSSSQLLLTLRAEGRLTQAPESADPATPPSAEARSAEHSSASRRCCLVLITVLSKKCFIYSRLPSLPEIIRISQIMLHDWLCYGKTRLRN